MRRTVLALVAMAAILGAACEMPEPPEENSTQTEFPIVLAEGLSGFGFFMIPEDLRAGGAIGAGYTRQNGCEQALGQYHTKEWL